MASAKRIKVIVLFLSASLFVAPILSNAAPAPVRRDKIPYQPQWVSVVKKGRLFKYRRRESSSPRIFGDRIFVGSDGGYFYAMEKKNGRKAWRFRAQGPINSSPAFWEGPGGGLASFTSGSSRRAAGSGLASFTSGSSRRAAGSGLVFFGDDKGILYALSVKDGKEQWRSDLGSEILTPPAVSGNKLIVATVEGRVAALSVGDGRLLWEKGHPFEAFAMTIRGNSPAVVDKTGDRIFIGFADGTLWALSVSDGKVLWEKRIENQKKGFRDIDGAPLVEGDSVTVATSDGGLSAMSRKTGQILWSREIGTSVALASFTSGSSRRAAGSGLASQGGRIIVSGSDGILYALSKKDGKEIWKTKIGTEALTAPVLHNDIIAVGLSGSTINFVDATDGHLIARRFATKGIYSDPIVDDDRVYYLSNGGRLYSLKFIR